MNWIPVQTKLPEKEVLVNVRTVGKQTETVSVTCARYDDFLEGKQRWFVITPYGVDTHINLHVEVTHWLPLPDPELGFDVTAFDLKLQKVLDKARELQLPEKLDDFTPH